MAMLLSGLPGLRPGNTNSPNRGSVFRIATTWGDNGTRWGSVRVLRSFRRSGGITKVLRLRSISVHLAPITSPVRRPVSSVTSRLRAFRNVTRGVGAKRALNKRKVKHRDLDQQHSNNFQSVSGHDGDLRGAQSDDSGLPRGTHTIMLFPFPD